MPPEQIENAFRILSSDPSVRAVFINVFGGILRVDRLAEGIIAAVRKLGLTLPVVLRAEGRGERVSRAADQPVWRDPETGYLRRQVFSRPDHPVELVRVEMPARQRVTLPASSYVHIRQALWVLSGSLVITEGGTRHVLAAGDCLGFGPPADTTFANESNAACTYLVALARS